jgi:hypothetical protein
MTLMKTSTKCDSLRVLGLLVLNLAAWGAPMSAHGGVITGATLFSGQSGTGPGVGLVSVPVVVTASPNNNNVGTDNNNITVAAKRFDQVGYIDIQFEFVNSDGVTEYKLWKLLTITPGFRGRDTR